MMAGDMTLPPKLQRLAEQADRNQFTQALAAALRGRTAATGPLEPTLEDTPE